MRAHIFLATLGCIAFVHATKADLINVEPGESIQAAIDGASDGDEIAVAPGTYVESIDFVGRAVIVRAIGGPDVTFLQAPPEGGSVVRCVSGEGPDTELRGFTVTGGSAGLGGGMFISGSGPWVRDCVFFENSADSGGGMAVVAESSATLITCAFSGNDALADGGGLYADQSEVSLTGCIFTGNSADEDGGGISAEDSVLVMSGCELSVNTADDGGGMYNVGSTSSRIHDSVFRANIATGFAGGGMYNTGQASPIVSGCTFEANESATNGGGMFNAGSAHAFIVNSGFFGNTADGLGGGMANMNFVSPTVGGCVFSGNTAFWGGGMANHNQTTPLVSNCTFRYNSAIVWGGAVQNGLDSDPKLVGCILWGNTAPTGPEIHNADALSRSKITYCDIESCGGSGLGWNPSLGDDLGRNLDVDPAFVDDDGPDDEPGTPDDDLRLDPGSACVDAGHNWGLPTDTADLDDDGDAAELLPVDPDDNPRVADAPGATEHGCGEPAIVDMGAYEAPGPPAGPLYLGDADGDGSVNVVDLLAVLSAWGEAGECELADLSLDHVVDVTDLLALLANWR